MGPLCNIVGMGRLLTLASIGHITGTLLTILSPQLGGFPLLLLSTPIVGLSNGTVEAVINPLVATMYPEEKTHKLNVLHACWPGGLVIGGLLTAILAWMGFGWQVRMATIMVAAVIYLALILGQKFPPTERAEAGVPFSEMFKEILRPGYLLLMLIMCMTAITELGPDQWVGSVLTDIVGIRGILFLVYTAGLMFVLRQFFAGVAVRAFTPPGLLAICSVFAAVGLFWLSISFGSPGMAFVAATLFGIGKTYYWPTMLGITSERFPKGGEFLLAVTGATGMIAAGVAGPVMGAIYDHYTIANLPSDIAAKVVINGRYSPEAAHKLMEQSPELRAAIEEALRHGASMTFRYVAILPVILIFVFTAMYLYFRARGGYRPVRLDEEKSGGL
ncbi:MFS transporter [Fervidibacter sacchari]|uniref:MFS family arabinose efflux permease n=1 Tax=Candidatus Fervidibacter sacchari TaxID=1448929 RepID=A0ABT2EQX7_9BACT|nr:MFS transporter [Candidatus Fervidibacter sacchari]MCS3920377.1 putative MFS family arabinose efflux permease [Candidatus Fervidibacter sacchari]WKU14663.1 MFS transporter [Candidatus Fervidibacter sacchari]